MTYSGFETFRRLALALPGTVESQSYGTPSFKVKDKLLARFHEDGVSLVLKMEFETRDFVMQMNPETYFITDHYRKYPYVLARLNDEVDWEQLKGHLIITWKSLASKKLLQRFEETNGCETETLPKNKVLD